MRIGGSVFLIALGAILAFAVTDKVNDVDLTMVGWIVMGAGVIGLAWAGYLTSRSNTRVVREDVVRTRDVY